MHHFYPVLRTKSYCTKKNRRFDNYYYYLIDHIIHYEVITNGKMHVSMFIFLNCVVMAGLSYLIKFDVNMEIALMYDFYM